MPKKIVLEDTEGDSEIRYIYDAAGIKLAKITVGKDSETTRTEYAGSYVYEDGNLQYQLFSEGRKLFDSDDNTWQYEYHLKDHLGNVRVVFEPERYGSESENTITQENHYYPFGLRISDLGLQNSENKYLYNGKEMQDEFGLDWHDYGARFYDAQIGRWHVVDPAYDLYYSHSPYHYVRNNPIKLTDPNGMWDDGYTVDEKGNIERVDNTGGDDYDIIYRKDEYDKGKTNNGLRVNDTGILSHLSTTYPGFVHKETDTGGRGKMIWAENPETGNWDYKKLHTMLQGHYAVTNNATEAKNVFQFVASNSDVEWSLIGNKSGKWFIGTSHSNTQAPNPSFAPYGSLETKNGEIRYPSFSNWPQMTTMHGFNPKSITYDAHSHSGSSPRIDFQPSDSDKRVAKQMRKHNLNVRMRLFMPKNPNRKWIDY